MNSTTNQSIADESRTRDAVPVWLIIVLFLLLFWGAVYFDSHGGWFEAKVYAPYTSVEDVQRYNVAGGPNPFETGRLIYHKPTCVVCHQANGLGQAGTFPPLAGSDWVNEPEPGRLIRAVLQGFQGPGLKVNGKPFETGGSMIPWNSLTDEEVAAVITYVRQEWGNKASAVTPEQVHAVRGKVKSHPQPFTPDELMKISPAE